MQELPSWQSNTEIFPLEVMALSGGGAVGWREFREEQGERRSRLCLRDARLMRRKRWADLLEPGQGLGVCSSGECDVQAQDKTARCSLAGSAAEYPERSTIIQKGNQP